MPYSRGPFGFQAESPGDTAGRNAGQPAWIFVTGAASLVHALLYGPTGLRWTADGPRLDPMLPDGFDHGMSIRGLRLGASTVTVQIHPRSTSVHLVDGPAVDLVTAAGRGTVTAQAPRHLPTRPGCSGKRGPRPSRRVGEHARTRHIGSVQASRTARAVSASRAGRSDRSVTSISCAPITPARKRAATPSAMAASRHSANAW